jgi:hypothetical protein
VCQINFWQKKERKKERKKKKKNNNKRSKHNMSPKLRLEDIMNAANPPNQNSSKTKATLLQLSYILFINKKQVQTSKKNSTENIFKKIKLLQKTRGSVG